MKLHTLIVDEFFEPVTALGIRAAAINVPFKPQTNPSDGIEYPGIQVCDEKIRSLIEATLMVHFDYAKIKLRQCFFRLSTWGTPQPHQVHTDVLMGKYTLLVYMNDKHPKVWCGTSILEHGSGLMDSNPISEYQEKVWARDQNNPQAWSLAGMCKSKFNRGLIIRSDLFHRSEPVGGFGVDSVDGRLVLCAFFEVLGEK